LLDNLKLTKWAHVAKATLAYYGTHHHALQATPSMIQSRLNHIRTSLFRIADSFLFKELTCPQKREPVSMSI
jgi:hypothetical protein